MTVRTEKNGQIVKPSQPAQAGGGNSRIAKTLTDLLMDPKNQAEIKRAMPRHLTPDRMVRIGLTALRHTRDLARCTPESFIGCMLQASQLGLEPNTPLGHCYLIPRRNRRREQREQSGPIFECTLIIGYQGMLELSHRSDRMVNISADVVREGDVFHRRRGLNPQCDLITSDDPDREAKEILHAFAVAELKNGGKPWLSLSRAQIEARRARSSSAEEGPWVTDFEAMCLKTAIRALWKFLPKSAEMAVAEHLEVASETGRSQTYDLEVQALMAQAGLQPPTPPEEEYPVPEPKDADEPAGPANGPAS